MMTECKQKTFLGTVKVGERGQIVIPKKIRDKYDIKPGDSLVVFGKEGKEVITIIKEDIMRDYALKILDDLDSSD